MTPFIRALMAGLVSLPLAACVTTGNQESLTTLYNCGPTPLSAKQVGDNIALNINGKIFDVVPVAAASGTKYQNMDARDSAPRITFWNKGSEATLEIDGKEYPACQMVKTSVYIDTTNYHAIGNDPAWFASISGNQLRLTTHYGDKTLTSPLPAPSMTLHGQYYSIKSDKHVMSMTIRNKSCQDTANNRFYPNEVSIIFDGEVFKGCGTNVIEEPVIQAVSEKTAAAEMQGAAKQPKTRRTWVAKQIDGNDVINPSRVIVMFEGAGKMSGNAGCNDFSGHYRAAGKTLNINPTIAMTKKACTPELMAQEKAFIDLLKACTLFEIRDEGLILSTPRRKTITFYAEPRAVIAQ